MNDCSDFVTVTEAQSSKHMRSWGNYMERAEFRCRRRAGEWAKEEREGLEKKVKGFRELISLESKIKLSL